MTKSELIELLSKQQPHLKADDVDLAVKTILEMMSTSLAEGNRIEIRGFGSFSLHYRPARTGRNPKTGEAVELSGKHVPHFKPARNCATASITSPKSSRTADRAYRRRVFGYPL